MRHEKTASTMVPILLTLSVVAIFLYLALFVRQDIITYLGLAAGTYLLLGAWYHHKKTSLTWTVFIEYVVIAFVVWFVIASLL